MDDSNLQRYLNKPTAAIHIPNSFTATERKLVNICLFEGLKDNFGSEVYLVDVKRTLEFLGCDRTKNTHWLKNQLFSALLSKIIRWNVLKADKTLQEWSCTFLSGYVHEPEDGTLGFSFNPLAVKQFQQRQLYSRLLLQMQVPFKSGHALALYEYLNDAMQRHKGDELTTGLRLNDLRLLLGVSDTQYLEFKHLNQRAIKPAFEEINKHTDIEVTRKLIRENRNVAGLQIVVKRKQNFQPTLDLKLTPGQLSEKPVSDEAKLLIDYGVTSNKAVKMAELYETDKIVRNVHYTINRAEKSTIKNFPSYLVKAITDDYAKCESGQNEIDIKEEWSKYRFLKAEEYFNKMKNTEQELLRSEYIQTIKNNKPSSLVRQKFEHDGGWNSRFIENDFRNKVLITLLKKPEELCIETFQEFWPQHQLKIMLEDKQKTVRSNQKSNGCVSVSAR